MTRVLVCGGREFNDADMVADALDGLDIDLIIEGGARGADRLAREYAQSHGITWITYEADWAKYGRAAGAIRNQAMLDGGAPDVVVAFAGNKGTADMVKRALKAGVPVCEYS